MLRFISFGSGSCGNCYYVYTENSGIIIDTGIGVRKLKKYFVDYGLSMRNVRHILITHDHADHVKAVGSLSNSYHIPVYSTEKVHEGIRNNYCVHKKIDPANVKIIEENRILSLGDFIISTFHVPHDSLDNIGFNIKYKERTLCIMTDIGHVTDEMAQAINEADYLVIESNHDEEMLLTGPYPEHLKRRVASDTGHLSNGQCATTVKNNMSQRLRHIWLCHLSQENNHPELARKTVEIELESSSNTNVQNVKIDVLKRNTPSDIYQLQD